jgi:hypothetical protein
MAKKINHIVVICTAIGVIGCLEGMALLQGIDGLLLTSVIAVIAGLAGWIAPQLKI